MASLLALAAVCCVSCAGAVAGVAARSRAQPAKSRTRPKARAVRAQPDLTATLAPLITDDGGHFAVAVDDLTTSEQAAYGGTQEFVTASIVSAGSARRRPAPPDTGA